jgi:hypothetical protein
MSLISCHTSLKGLAHPLSPEPPSKCDFASNALSWHSFCHHTAARLGRRVGQGGEGRQRWAGSTEGWLVSKGTGREFVIHIAEL